jgi:hypothetical protein
MGTVTLCTHLPCKVDIVVHVVTRAAHPSGFTLAAPFLLTSFIIVLSVVTTHAVVSRGESWMTKDWTPDELKDVEAHQSPQTYAQTLPWVVDAAQIPAILGTPLAGIFVLEKKNVLVFYTAVLGIGAIVFFYFLMKVKAYDYSERGLKLLGYRVSPLAIGGIILNLVCAVLAAWVIQ